jgi:hypothetical protein
VLFAFQFAASATLARMFVADDREMPFATVLLA